MGALHSRDENATLWRGEPGATSERRCSMTLREYFQATYAPSRLRGKNRVYCHQYLSAITCLELSKGVEPGTLLLHEITEDDLDAMKAKCIAEDYAPITVTKYRWLLRSVLR